MATGVISPAITFQGYTGNGALNAGGFVATYAAGTTTPIATYTDSTLGTPNSNPVRLNAIGQAPIWLTPGVTYKFIETDALGNQCGYADQVQGPLTQSALTALLTQQFIGGILYPQTAAEIAASVTPTSYFYPALNVLRYGTNTNPGVTDMTAAFLAAIQVASVGGTAGPITEGTGGIVLAPPGKYLITAVLPIAANNVSIQGAGPGATSIIMGSTTQNGIYIGATAAIWHNCFISDLTIEAAGIQSSGAAITIMNAGNCGVFNVIFGYNLYWALNLDAFTAATGGYSYFVDQVQLNTCVQGILVGQTGGTSFIQDLFLTNITITGASVCGLNFLACSGVFCNNISTADCGIGVNINPPTGSNCNALWFDTVLSDTTTGNAWNIAPTGTGIITEVIMTDCWGCGAGNTGASVSRAAGVVLNQGSGTINGVSIIGGVFHRNTAAAIIITAANNVLIKGIQAYQNSIPYGGAGDGLYSAIEVAANVSNFVIDGNLLTAGGYFATVNPITNGQAYGVHVATGSSNNYQITGNLVTANFSGGISDGGSGTTKVVANNVGWVTRAEGITGAIATGVTVTHGLSVTPTVVQLTAQDGTPTAVYPSSIGTTTFVINYAGGGTHAFAWTASIPAAN